MAGLPGAPDAGRLRGATQIRLNENVGSGARPDVVRVDRQALTLNVLDDMAAVLSRYGQRPALDAHATRVRARRADAFVERDGIAKIERLLALLRAGQGAGAPWLQLARALFPDASDLALALQELRRRARLDGTLTEADSAALERELQALIARHGARPLIAGSHVARLARQFGLRVDGAARRFVETYRMLVAAELNDVLFYEYVIELFGFATRGRTIDYFERALALDMHLAQGTPGDAAHEAAFAPLVQTLFQLRLVRSADEILLCRAGHAALATAAPVADPDSFDASVVRLLLNVLQDADTTASSFEACLTELFRYTQPALLHNWLKALLRAFGDLPVEIFPDLAHREAVLAALAQAGGALLNPGGASSLTGAKRA